MLQLAVVLYYRLYFRRPSYQLTLEISGAQDVSLVGTARAEIIDV
jgi:hypothetical protein